VVDESDATLSRQCRFRDLNTDIVLMNSEQHMCVNYSTTLDNT